MVKFPVSPFASNIEYAIRDVDIPAMEVHISDIHNREDFRKKLVLSDVCIGTITGKGKQGYLEAVKQLRDLQ